MTTKVQARVALDKALANGGSLDILFTEEKDAISFRFLIYKARKDFAKQLAKIEDIPVDQVRTDYDDMTVTVKLVDNGYACCIRTLADALTYRDPNTGQEL